MIPFHERRRQQFITEQYFYSKLESWADTIKLWSNNLPAEGDSDDHRQSLAAADVAEHKYFTLSINYTAGEPIDPLRNGLEAVVDAYEQYANFLRVYENEPDYPVFGFQEIGDFERMAQLVSLALLLHRRDLIPRLHALIESSAYDGVDAMYEELVSHVFPDRPYLENWFHKKPYIHLLNATDLDDPKEKTKELKTYCKEWFPAMKSAPWHNSHLRMTETDGDYFGYWAFEAGAISLLYNIDDSTIDHMVYPRDLVAWARANEHLSEETHTKLRCEAKELCPKTGFWLTPAKLGSRRHFTQGEIMPNFPGSTYGMTIWMWDQNQE